MAICEVKPELWVNRFQQIKKQLAVDRPSEMAQKIDQQARVIFMKTIYGPDVSSIVQEWKREKNIPGPTYKVTPEGLICFYAGKEISLRELAVNNVREQTPQNHNPKEEEILLLAERAILQSPTAEVVFPIYNEGRIRYLSQWKRKDNLVETAMIDISQDGQDKTLEEATIFMEQMAEEKKGRIKTDLDKQVNLSIDLAEAVEIPVPMIQFIETKASLATVIHNTVANDYDNHVSPVLSESALLFSAVEQNLERTAVLEQNQAAGKSLPKAAAMAESLFILDHAIQPARATQVMSPVFKIEQTSMIQIIEENSETASDSTKPSSFNHDLVTWQPIFKKEWAQVQKEAAVKLVDHKIIPDVFQPQILMVREAVSDEIKKTEERWQTKDAVAYLDCYHQGAVVAEKVVIGVAQTEQPFLEKAVKEFSLPLWEIAADTAPAMVIKASLKPVIQMAEQSTAFNFETESLTVRENERSVDDKIVLVKDQLPVPVKEKVIYETEQKQERLFWVENFSVVSTPAAKAKEKPVFQIKKLVWRTTAFAPEPTEVSILELELPKDQKLYALYHFLQKVVKKVLGEDSIRTRQVTVIAEREAVNLDLELVREIEYYLQLLRRKNYAQAFAFAD